MDAVLGGRGAVPRRLTGPVSPFPFRWPRNARNLRGGFGLHGGSGASGTITSAQWPHGRARAGCRAPQPHPHLLAHEFKMTDFSWEYFGLREDFGYWDDPAGLFGGTPRRFQGSGAPVVHDLFCGRLALVLPLAWPQNGVVMSMQPRPWPDVPELTAKMARSSSRQGNLAMRIRDELGEVYAVPCSRARSGCGAGRGSRRAS